MVTANEIASAKKKFSGRWATPVLVPGNVSEPPDPGAHNPPAAHTSMSPPLFSVDYNAVSPSVPVMPGASPPTCLSGGTTAGVRVDCPGCKLVTAPITVSTSSGMSTTGTVLMHEMVGHRGIVMSASVCST